jgi:hypothetical protein
MKKTKQILLGLLLVAGLTGVVAAQQKYEATVPWQKFVGKVLFSGPVEFDNTVDFDSATLTDLTIADDLTVSDDLTVTDDAAVTGDLAVTGTTTFTGGLVSGSVLYPASPVVKVYYGVAALTEAGGTETVLTLSLPTAATGAGVVVNFSIFATDGTDHEVRTGTIFLSGVNKAGTASCGVLPADQTLHGIGTSGGTLTYAIASTGSTTTCPLTVNIDSDDTLTSAQFRYEATLIGSGSIS